MGERPVRFRVGTGYDLHRLTPGRALILGGVAIPCEVGLEGHSDADALAHAVTDALLGAAALGNIGRLFPDTDPRYKDADSMVFVQEAARLVRDAGYRVANIDSTIVAQQPKLGPYLDAMCERMAECAGLETGCVSVKAKTNEGVGPEGRCEAIRVHAVVLIEEV